MTDQLQAATLWSILNSTPSACYPRYAREINTPIIVDGSGINVIAAQPELVVGYGRCMLTPNIAELGRIARAVRVPVEGPMGSQWQRHVLDIAAAFAGPVVVSKGPTDIISDGAVTMSCSQQSSPRRCGGQGDVLAGGGRCYNFGRSFAHCYIALPCPPGLAGTYLSWSLGRSSSRPASQEENRGAAVMAAAVVACNVLRMSSFRAFQKSGRGMGAGCVIPEIQTVAQKLIGS